MGTKTPPVDQDECLSVYLWFTNSSSLICFGWWSYT